MRFEIQALRAVAVLGVLLFHLWPLRLQGGYVGVDVFFVVSGYLITDHLLREFVRTGRVSLPAFWGRRARRLLPASMLVLAVTAIGVFAVVPLTRWAQFGWEIIASAFYVENWALAGQSVDYMALSNAKSPVQHFWTLGVEEQFYILWPVLFLIGSVVAARLGRRRIAGVILLIALATAASFVYSVIYTGANPSVAYFSTFTRAWEFGAGALLAVVLRRIPIPFSPRVAAASSWIGFAAIAAAMLLFTGATPFPSYTALLPVLGTVMVIAAGMPSTIWAPTRAITLRPVQFVGDVSYGVYLWHWPLIVLLPYATGHALTTLECVGLLVVSILLGWASKRFVEDPARSWSFLAGGRPRRSLLGAAIAMALVSAIALPLALTTIPPPPKPPVAAPSCWGAQAMADERCTDPQDAPLVAPAESFAADLPSDVIAECEVTVERASFHRCDREQAAAAAPHIALVGDSHATRWVDVFDAATQENGWGLSTFLVSGCPLVTSDLLGSAWGFDPVGAELCPVPTEAVIEEIAADPTITDVVLTNRTRLYVSPDPQYHPLQATSVAATIDRLQDAGKRVTVLKDPPEIRAVPQQGGGSAIDCLASRIALDCTLPRADADFADPMAEAAGIAGADLLDLTDMFCDDERCYWAIGGLVVYTDDNHLTRSFSTSLGPILAERLRESLL